MAVMNAAIEANGWVLRVEGAWPASTFSSFDLDPNGAPKVAIATTSAGFSRAGAAAAADPARVRGGVVATRPLRRPWPDHLLLDEADLGGGVRRVRLALSRYIYPGDPASVTFAAGWRAGLAGQTIAATNGSTHAVRLPSARWATPQYLHETGPFRIDLLVANIETENLSAAAAVRVTGHDGTNTQSWWLTESVSDRFGDGLKCWGATIDPTGLTPGIITLHWEVYPWVGAMRTSGLAHVVDTEAGFSQGSDAPLHVCWDAGGARYGGHHVYVDPAGTLTPSLVTVGATLAIAKAGTRAANNFVAMQALENLSRALPAANGYPAVIARTLEGATITFSPGVHTVAYGNLLTTARTVEARLVLQGDPDDPDPRNNVIWRTGTGTGNPRVTRMLFRNMSIELGGAWPGLSWRSHFDNVTLRGRAGDEAATAGLTSSVTVGFFRLSFTRCRYWRYGLGLGGSTMVTGLARNLEFIRTVTSPMVVTSTRVADATVPVGSSGMVGGGLGGLTDSFIWGVRSFANDNTGFSFALTSGTGTTTSPSRRVRGNVINSIFERPNNGSASMGDAFFLSSGNQEFVDCLIEGSTFVGQRVNWGYNDPTDALTNMVSIGNAVRNSFFERRACKHDIFTQNGNLIAGWSNLYAVNEEANVQVDRTDWTGTDAFAREFEGLRSVYVVGSANNPDAAGNFIFANDASRLSLQGSVLGYGNYLPGATSLLLDRGRRACIDTDAGGTVRPAMFDTGAMELASAAAPVTLNPGAAAHGHVATSPALAWQGALQPHGARHATDSSAAVLAWFASLQPANALHVTGGRAAALGVDPPGVGAVGRVLVVGPDTRTLAVGPDARRITVLAG